jgi:hypothetical protein
MRLSMLDIDELLVELLILHLQFSFVGYLRAESLADPSFEGEGVCIDRRDLDGLDNPCERRHPSDRCLYRYHTCLEILRSLQATERERHIIVNEGGERRDATDTHLRYRCIR